MYADLPVGQGAVFADDAGAMIVVSVIVEDVITQITSPLITVL